MMIPITRKEKYINEIVGGGDTAPETPYTREEFFLAEILGEVIAPSPVTRVEKYLSAIAGQYSGEMPEPVTRIERFIARAAGMDVTIPTPITREEMFWADYALIVEKKLSGIPPLTFNAIAGTLKDYRIYGNTAGGESVGDLVAEGEHAGEYKVAVKVEGKNLCNNIWEQKAINADSGNAIPNENTVCCDFIPVKPNVTYSCSRTIANNYNNLRCYGANKNYLGSGEVLANKANPLPQGASFGTFMITDARVSYIRFNDLSNSLDTKYMLVEGVYTAETMPPYEPYHVPITTPVYLPEPIKIVGDEAEYIDYAEQKQHFADGTSTDVLLPALPTISGTNTLSVGTEVQPSKVYIKGEKEREYS